MQMCMHAGMCGWRPVSQRTGGSMPQQSAVVVVVLELVQWKYNCFISVRNNRRGPNQLLHHLNAHSSISCSRCSVVMHSCFPADKEPKQNWSKLVEKIRILSRYNIFSFFSFLFHQDAILNHLKQIFWITDSMVQRSTYRKEKPKIFGLWHMFTWGISFSL